MRRTHRRQYEMFLRVRDFAKAHAQVFSETGAGRDALAAVDKAINELTVTDLLKSAASASARATRLTERRKALTDLLTQVSQLARVLRASGKDVPPFALPVSKSDQSLLTAARHFARDVAAFDDDFGRHAMGSKVIGEVSSAFEAATRDRGMSRADHVAATTRIQDLIGAALLDLRRLDLLVNRELAGDNVVRAVWKAARRVGKVTRITGAPASEASEELATPHVAEAPAPLAAPAPAVATAIPPLPATTVQ